LGVGERGGELMNVGSTIYIFCLGDTAVKFSNGRYVLSVASSLAVDAKV
jgi:hypothetical protein